MQCLVYQQVICVLHSLRDMQPVKFFPRKWYYVVILVAIDNYDCIVQNRVKMLHLTG